MSSLASTSTSLENSSPIHSLRVIRKQRPVRVSTVDDDDDDDDDDSEHYPYSKKDGHHNGYDLNGPENDMKANENQQDGRSLYYENTDIVVNNNNTYRRYFWNHLCCRRFGVVLLLLYSITVTMFYIVEKRTTQQQQHQQQPVISSNNNEGMMMNDTDGNSSSSCTSIVDNNNSDAASSSSSSVTTLGTSYFSTVFNTSIPLWKPLPNRNSVLTRLAFGSCSSQSMPQPYWDTILQTVQPNIFIMMGDNVYGDCNPATSASNYCPELIQAYYDMAKHPSVLGSASQVSILSTLDDHDYGLSDCHANNLYKRIAQRYFLEFFTIPKMMRSGSNSSKQPTMEQSTANNDPNGTSTMDEMKMGNDDDNPYVTETALPLGRYEYPNTASNDNDGIYRASVWGSRTKRNTTTSTSSQQQLVQIILLDTRYNRSPFLETNNSQSPYMPPPPSQPPSKKSSSTSKANKDDTSSSNNNNNDNNDNNTYYEQHFYQPQQMLGEKQWKWLEYQLYNVTATIRFIVSSFQVLNDSTGFDSWRHLPKERQRLYQLISNTIQKDESTIIILSGDRHLGGFYAYNYTSTTTSATTGKPTTTTTPIVEVTSSALTHSIPLHAYNSTCTSAIECDEYDPNRIGSYIRENNFGAMNIDWENGTITISLCRSDSTYGVSYNHSITSINDNDDPQHHFYYSRSDAGHVIQSQTYPMLQIRKR